jgi:hypothetical protein
MAGFMMLLPGGRLAALGTTALVVAAIFLAVYWVDGGAAFPTDDAFINLHNAQVLRLGHDDSYPGVPALIGATSGAHLALLFAVEQFIRSGTTALFVLSCLIGLAYVAGVFCVGINVGCSRLEASLIALLGIFLAGTLFQLLNGMDTGLAMAAVAWNIKLLTDQRRALWLAVLCGVMPFVRPELGFLSAGSMLILISDDDHKVGFKTAAVALAVCSAVPFLVWYWIDTGSFVPNTVNAKMYYFAERYAAWPDKAGLVLRAITEAIVASFPLFLCLRFIRPRAIGFLFGLFIVVFAGSFFWKFPGGLLHNGGRYLYVFVPIVLFGVACGLVSASRRHTLRLAAISVLFLPLGLHAQYTWYRTNITGNRASLTDLVSWLDANVPGRPTVMVHDAGYIAYAGRFPLVDLVGLKTPDAAKFHEQLTYPSAGELRSSAVAKIALAYKPQYFVVLQDWDQTFQLVAGLRGNGWGAKELYAGRAPTDTPATSIYHLYELTPPEVKTQRTD